jgi:hypothetical protein
LISDNWMTSVECPAVISESGDLTYKCPFLKNANGDMYVIWADSDTEFISGEQPAGAGWGLSQIQVWIRWLGERIREIMLECRRRDLLMNCPGGRELRGIHLRVGPNLHGNLQGESIDGFRSDSAPDDIMHLTLIPVTSED